MMIEIGLALDLLVVVVVSLLAWKVVTAKSEDGLSEGRINELARLMAIDIAREERSELQRENSAHVKNLDDEYDRKKKDMDKEVKSLKEENVSLKTLVDKVSAAQESTAEAVKGAREVSLKVANALGGDDPHVKKEYGEGRAENILTFAGFREGEHFLKQPALAPYEGNKSGKSPDIVLLLPGGGAVAIDCKAIVKAGFNAFYELDGEEDATEKKKLLRDHAGKIWETVKELATRNYPFGLEQQFGQKGPDYTLMFIPNEEFYYRAEIGVSDNLRKSMGANTLREAAIRKGVFFCSPDGLAMRAIELTAQWKSISAFDEVNDVLALVQDVAEAIVRTEESRALHHKALEEVRETWNDHVKFSESTTTKEPSQRVAITNLFEVVGAKSTFSSMRGKKGSKAEPVPLTEISKPFREPTKTKVMDIHLGARLDTAAAEEEE